MDHLHDVLQRIDACADEHLWPGFDVLRVPLAIFDGASTWLVRHPSVPEPFGRTNDPQVHHIDGRHPAVVANTATTIGEHLCATALLPNGIADADDVAKLLVHEAFHVWQRHEHPDWGASESAHLLYPRDDVDVIDAVMTEAEALAVALHAGNDDEAAAWLATAMSARERRASLLSEASIQFDRDLERLEGLAHYVELLAQRAITDERTLPVRPDLTNVRSRGYWSGAVKALLMDRFNSEWQQRVNDHADVTMDSLLHEVLAHRGAEPATIPDRVATQISERAVAAAEEARAHVDGKREAYMARPGWRIEVRGESEPLRITSFDPMNIEVLADGDLLHTRMVSIEGPGAHVSVFGGQALTQAAGADPLADGIAKVIITGVQRLPEQDYRGDVRVLSGMGLTIRVAGESRALNMIAPRDTM